MAESTYEGQTLRGSGRLVDYSNLVKLPHTVFALPFALVGATLASYRYPLRPSHLVWILLAFTSPGMLVKVATNIMNFALGISCFHTLYVNLTLIPRALRPGWFARTGLVLAGVYFLTLAAISATYTIVTALK